jgi:hypothetical protein
MTKQSAAGSQAFILNVPEPSGLYAPHDHLKNRGGSWRMMYAMSFRLSEVKKSRKSYPHSRTLVRVALP